MFRILILLLIIPLFGYSQSLDSRAFIQKVSEHPGYVHYTMKIFPGKFDKSFKVELSQIDSLDNETILSEPMINIKTTVYKKGYKMDSGKVFESLYISITENDKWSDEYIVIRDCSESTYLAGLIKLKKSEIYKLKIFNQNKIFYEERIELK